MVEAYRDPSSHCSQLPSPDGHPASLKLADHFLVLVSLSGAGFSIDFLHNVTLSGQTYVTVWCLPTLWGNSYISSTTSAHLLKKKRVGGEEIRAGVQEAVVKMMRKIWPNLGDVLPMVMGKAFFKIVNPTMTLDNDGYTRRSPCAKPGTWEADVHASSPSRPSVSLQSHVPSKCLIPHFPLNPVFYATFLTGHTYIFSKDFGCWEWKRQKTVAVPFPWTSLCCLFWKQSRVSKSPSLISNAQWFISVPFVLPTLYIQLYILGKEIYFLSDVKAFAWHDGNLWVVTPSSSPRTQENNSWQGMRRGEQSLQTEPNGHSFLLTGDIYGFPNILV